MHVPIDINTPPNQTDDKSGLHARLLRALGAETFGNVITLAIQVSAVPLFLSYWGTQLYGEWLLIATVPNYLAMSDLGFASAAGTAMTMKVAQGDKAGALKVFQSAWVLISSLSLTIVAIAIALSFLLPLSSWFRIQLLSESQLHLIVPLLVLQIFFVLQRQLIGLGYRCDGNYAVGSMANSLKRSVDFVVLVSVLMLGGNPVTLVTVNVITDLLSTAFFYFDVRRRSPWLRPGTELADKKTIQGLVMPAIAFMGFPLGHALNLQGMLSVVGIALGPQAVVLFSTTRTLTRSIAQLLGSINNTLWVELSTAFGVGNISLARTLHRRTCQASLWMSILLGAGLLLVGKTVFAHWTKGKVEFDFSLHLLLLVEIVLNGFWAASHIVPMATNRHQRIAAVYVSATAVALIVAANLSKMMGIYGGALSLIIIDIVMIAFVLPLSLKMVNDPFSDFLRSVLAPKITVPRQLLPARMRKA